MVPVGDSVAVPGTVVVMVCDGEECVGEKGVGFEDNRGCYVTVDKQDFGEEVGGVDEAGKEEENKAEELLTGPLFHPI